jgi:DNA-binding response OmpR family regulator
MCILIVDDNIGIRAMFTDLLSEEGYEVVGVANGQEALTYLRQCAELPRLILLDLAMPIMTGWDFLHQQQHDAALAAIPVVLMTSRGHFDQEGHDITAIDYIHKPTDLATMLATIRHHYPLPLNHRAVT